MIGFVFLLCLLFRWGVLHRVLLVVGWCWVLYSSGSLCVSFHYFLGISAPTPKAQGFISGQEWRFHKWFVMALSEIKTNTQNQITKVEPHINCSYKIRQMIIKIMEYTRIHIHPWAKKIEFKKNKVQSIDLMNKGNPKLYLPVESSLTKAQSWK